MKYTHGSNQFKKTLKITAKSEVKRIMKESMKVVGGLSLVTIAVIGLVGYGSASTQAQFVYASVPVDVVSTSTPDIPVMDRIIQCESDGHQFNSQGQVLIHVNSNGTYDEGIGQVNSIWNSTATKMGYDLSKQSDNIAFTRWLILNKGTQIYYSSENCWNK